MIKILSIAFFSLVYTFSIHAQFDFIYNDSIVVRNGTDTLNLPWAGGMNHPQFSTIDIDFDGNDELVAFEPESNIVKVFKRSFDGNDLVYKLWYNAHKLFPDDVKYRMQLVDFNKDGKKDLFTYANGGLKVYKNIGNPQIGLKWKLYKDPVEATVNGNTSNLYVASNVIPAFSDVDNDGDMDILSYHQAISRVQWYKNLTIENYGNNDSLEFILQEPCWGDFTESSSGNQINLDSDDGPCGGMMLSRSEGQRHSGGSILALDMNNSGLKDLIIGDVSYSSLALLINDGTSPSDNAFMISQENDFPSSSVSVDLPTFPTAYYEDVDLDSIKDLIISTTSPGISENTKGVWMYKNNGDENNPDFNYVQDDFLQGQMIENGKGAIPIVVDVNDDGLNDLLVANSYNYYESQPNSSRINYYKNVGNSTVPTFQLVNENWQNFANSGFSGRVAPTFGDLDNDGDLDMIIGLVNGKLYFYENPGGSGSMNFSIAQVQLQNDMGSDITVSNYATPELFDLNNDGLLDLIIGQSIGGLVYYENVGTSSNYSFQLKNTNLGNVDLSTSSYVQSVGVPRFIRTNDTTYLIAGNRTGNISLYDDLDGNLASGNNFNLIAANYLEIDTKGYSAPFVADLTNNNRYHLFVGNELGGLWSYAQGDTSLNENLAVDEYDASMINFKVYPNPVNEMLIVQLNGIYNYSYQLIDQMGRRVKTDKGLYSSATSINVNDLDAGVYILKITIDSNQEQLIKKIIVED